mgnify:CR=1 FL=1
MILNPALGGRSPVMPDRISKEARSANMAAVRGRDTKPERIVRSRLFRAGFRYRLHERKLPGAPDVVLPRYRTAVFVHGCFWHGHDCPRGRRPNTNQEFWNVKIDANAARDRRNRTALEGLGWTVYTLWTCRLEADLEHLLNSLKALRAAEVTSEPRPPEN